METQKVIRQSALTLFNHLTGKQACRQKLLVIIYIRLLLLLVSMTVITNSHAQKIWEQRKGCIRAQGNLAPGYLFSQKNASAYIDGDMDLFLDNKVSFTGAAWYSFALNRKNATGLKANHALFGGLNYHFLKPSRWDPYIGLTPGLGIVQVDYRDGEQIKHSPYQAAPLMSASVGCNYYIGWIFHVFVKVQAVTGQTFGSAPTPTRLDELKFMAGLGWNLRLWKPKHKDSYMPVMIKS